LGEILLVQAAPDAKGVYRDGQPLRSVGLLPFGSAGWRASALCDGCWWHDKAAPAIEPAINSNRTFTEWLTSGGIGANSVKLASGSPAQGLRGGQQ